MSEECTIEWNENGRAKICGPLTFESTPALFRQVEHKLEAGARIEYIDLEDVSRIDSAGLALLLEWQARQLASGKPLTIENAPSSLMRLARLCEATETLQISQAKGKG
jgi:phospholipid transport system transporter-binding protein